MIEPRPRRRRQFAAAISDLHQQTKTNIAEKRPIRSFRFPFSGRGLPESNRDAARGDRTVFRLPSNLILVFAANLAGGDADREISRSASTVWSNGRGNDEHISFIHACINTPVDNVNVNVMSERC